MCGVTQHPTIEFSLVRDVDTGIGDGRRLCLGIPWWSNDAFADTSIRPQIAAYHVACSGGWRCLIKGGLLSRISRSPIFGRMRRRGKHPEYMGTGMGFAVSSPVSYA